MRVRMQHSVPAQAQARTNVSPRCYILQGFTQNGKLLLTEFWPVWLQWILLVKARQTPGLPLWATPTAALKLRGLSFSPQTTFQRMQW